jgi:antitoxin component of RelBE/YafQ-DinJ toxin-antitoxin module
MKTVISVKVDKDVRDNARRVSKKIGVPISMAVNQYLKEFIATERVEFHKPLVPNAKTRKILDKALRDIREGNTEAFSPAFTNMKDAIKWLNRE